MSQTFQNMVRGALGLTESINQQEMVYVMYDSPVGLAVILLQSTVFFVVRLDVDNVTIYSSLSVSERQPQL